MRARRGWLILAWTAAAVLAAPAWGQAPARRSAVIVPDAAQSGYLGIGVADITSERAKALNLKEERGAEVTSVNPDTPAAKAGIQKGDVVLEYNGQPVQGTAQFTRMVRETPAGRQVRIVVSRNGSNQKLTATIEPRKDVFTFGGDRVIEFPRGEFPNLTGVTIPRIQPMDIPLFHMAWRSQLLGIAGEGLGNQPQLAEFFGVKDGVLVKSVIKGSPAEKAGIKAGDVVTKLEDIRVADAQGIRNAVNAQREKKQPFTVTVVRGKKEILLQVTVEKETGSARPIRAAGAAHC